MEENSNSQTSNQEWINSMKRTRVVEFWTHTPNGPVPSTEEKLRYLAEMKYGDALRFERRLGAYHLPVEIMDEDLVNWDGERLVNESKLPLD